MKKIILSVSCLSCLSSLFAQNVGIGTPTPTYKLTVATTGQGYGIVHTNGSVSMGTYLTAGSGWLGTVTNHPLHFFTNDGLPTMSINSGNVGIGTVSPSQKLDVQGNVFISNYLGIGTTTPASPLSFPNTLGKKISFWTNGSVDYGIGLQSGALQIYTGGSDLITFGYGSPFTETMRFATGTGQLMIGTSQAAGKLHLAANGEALRLSGSNPFLTFFDGSNNYKGYMWNNASNIEIGTDFTNTNGEVNLKTKGVQGLTVQSDGRVRVGEFGCINSLGLGFGGLPKFSIFGPLGFKKTTGDQVGEWAIGYWGSQDNLSFHFNSGQKAFIESVDGSWNQASDFRLKENFENYKCVIDGIKKLDVLTYHYKADKTGTRSFGLVAQNVQQYFPELVSGNAKNKDEYLAIAYGKTGVLAIKAIQEQQVIIETLQKQVEAAKAEIPMQIGKQQEIIETLQNKIEQLEKRLAAAGIK